MLDSWLIDEVQWLLNHGFDPSLQSMQGIGYKEVVGYLKWDYDKETMVDLLKMNTHYLAKKQRTWFRRYISDWMNNPRSGVDYRLIKL